MKQCKCVFLTYDCRCGKPLDHHGLHQAVFKKGVVSWSDPVPAEGIYYDYETDINVYEKRYKYEDD